MRYYLTILGSMALMLLGFWWIISLTSGFYYIALGSVRLYGYLLSALDGVLGCVRYVPIYISWGIIGMMGTFLVYGGWVVRNEMYLSKLGIILNVAAFLFFAILVAWGLVIG